MTHSMIADDMVIFAKVVEMNGFTAAARVLGVPKVRISRSVAQLERELSVRLLERTTRRIALTAPGRSILAHCQRVALEAEAARAALLPVASGASLRVSVDQAYGRLLVAPLVPRFLERFPQVALRLVNAGEEGEAGGYDVELRSDGRLAEGEVASSLGTPPMILCAAPAYLTGKTLPQTPSELGAHALLWSTTESAPQLRLSKDGGTVAIPCTPRLTSADPQALHSAVAAGLGIGVLPEFLCRNGLAMRRLVQVLPDWQVADKVELQAVSPAHRAGEPAVRSFVDFLAANIVPVLAGGGAQVPAGA